MYDVMKYIHENIRESLSVSDTARRFGYSKWYFCKKFHDFTGMTFLEYVRHYRIQLAALDILSGCKVTDVALDYGYDTIGGFNKAFLTHYGCLPQKYKKYAKESQYYYEKRRMTMYKLTDRCMLLRDEAVCQKSYQKNYCMQRNVYFTIGAANSILAGKAPEENVSDAIIYVLEKFKPFIIPGEMIVGFNFGDAEYDYMPQDNDKDRVIMKQNGISEEDMLQYFEAHANKYHSPNRGELENSKEEEQSRNEWAGIGRCIDSNHSVIGYEKVLRLGFKGILNEVEKYEQINGENAEYTAMKKLCYAAGSIGEKYAEEAERLLAAKNSAYHRDDLEKMIATCRKVPRYPATTFFEAVQALWFAHIINTWEDDINANSLGRLDQILYPYYKADIESGRLTKEQAFEIICCLWIKLYRDYDVQQSCIGGSTPDGESCVNELSYLMLDVTEQLDFIRCLSVRYNKNTDKKFLRRALEVVGHVQKGIPFFFNDDILTEALMYEGIAKEDAFDYTQIGCVETVIPGKSNPHAVTGETNLLKAIEYVLCNGNSMMYPEYSPGIKTGEPDRFHTWQQFYDAVMIQVDKILDITCSQVKKSRDVCYNPRPYKSLLTKGCIETGRDFNDGGAVYDYYQIMLGGIPNLADSLAVIRKFVFKEKKYSLAQLKTILENDFEDESIRAEFINRAPKFGNDIDEVDHIAVDIINHSCDTLKVLSGKYGLSFHVQPFTFLWLIEHGAHSAASADGRHKGEPIAYSVSPMQGRDFNGLTAVLNSIAKLPAKRTAGTTSAIVEVDPKLFTDMNLDVMTDILMASSLMGLSNVQFNVIDADTLIDAQKNPERYNNLAVRVSGFSQKFNLLSPQLQDHIIGRTKHTCI